MMLRTRSYYMAQSRRLFGPNDVTPVQEEVVEVRPGDILLCKNLLYAKKGWLGGGKYGFFEICESGITISIKTSGNFKAPGWLRAASPLELLATAIRD